MNDNYNVYFLINGFWGGGAERVIELIAEKIKAKGYQVTIVLTDQTKKAAQSAKYYNNKLAFISLVDSLHKLSCIDILKKSVLFFTSYLGIKLYKITKFNFFGKAYICSFALHNYEKILALRKELYPNATIVAFQDKSIQIALLMPHRKINKLIISERGNPEKHNSSPITLAFIRCLYPKADYMVFQTSSASDYYSDIIKKKSEIIPNPLFENIPQPYKGEREKVVVNFCRFSPEKNLSLLINAFSIFVKNFPEYTLKIYGNKNSTEAIDIIETLRGQISLLALEEKVELLDFRIDIHEEIKKCAMFVSSSDYEGMSNSMLEAMAIGLPTICTDCPAGGARDIIDDGINGVLVPVNDPIAMSDAMQKIASSTDFSKSLSKESIKIREKLNADIIVNRWENILFK